MIFANYFERDETTEASNLARRGVSFVEAVAAFADPQRVVLPDANHSGQEPRWYCLGKVGDAILTLRFTRRGDRVRLCGAGYWRKGKRLYETQNSLR